MERAIQVYESHQDGEIVCLVCGEVFEAFYPDGIMIYPIGGNRRKGAGFVFISGVKFIGPVDYCCLPGLAALKGELMGG